MSNVKIQLESGYLDVKEGTAFPLNFGVADIRDITKRSGATSKTITLSGTKNNHDLLNHYYDVNVEAGTFNINTLTKCIVLQNDLPILEDGYIQLLSVNKKQSTVDYEIDVEYEVMVKDSQSDFFTQIDNKELSDIDLSDLNHTITAANVVASFSNTVTDGYKYVLPLTTDPNYPLKEMRPAVYAKTYFDRIFEGAGYQYDWTTLSTARFDKLVIPFNGDIINYDYTDYDVIETARETIDGYQTAPYWSSFFEQITAWGEVQDNQNLFNNTLGEYTVPFAFQGGDSITFTFDLEYDINAVNATGATAYLVDMQSSPSTKSVVIRPYIQLLKNGSNFIWSGNQLASATVSEGASYANGTTAIVSSVNDTVSITISNLLSGDIIEIKAGINVEYNASGNYRPRFRSNSNPSLGANVLVDLQLDLLDVTMSTAISSNTLPSGATMFINRYVPAKVKQKDFIKSIFTMYNLYTEIDPSEPNVLILKHRDDYYDSGAEIDWTYKLAKERDQQLQFLPELSNKKLVLTYKQDSDEPNKIYFDATREVYGQVEFTFDNEYVKGVDTKELMFSPTPVTQTVFGAYVPMIYGAAPKTNVRILYDGGTSTCQPYNIYDYANTGQTGLTTYPLMHHWDDPLNPSFDINFATCDYYYYSGYEATNNNLYNLYWRRTISQINSGKMLTAYFDLNESDIQSLKLNAKVRIDNSWWHINRVIDYDPNIKQLTKVELMSVDDEIDYVPFKTKPITYKPTKGEYSQAVGEIFRQRSLNSNTYGQGSDVMIKGVNNIVLPSVRGFIEGDGNIMESDGIITDTINTTTSIGENFANTDLVFTGTRIHDTAGYDLTISTDGTGFNESYIYMGNSEGFYAGFDTNYLEGSPNYVSLNANNSAVLTATTNNVEIEKSLTIKVANKSALYTITDSDYLINCTSGTFTVNLPTAVGRTGRQYVVKNSGSGTITLDGDGTETIDGATTFTLTQYVSVTVVSDGANWIITAVN
jgi:hypothetical protein